MTTHGLVSDVRDGVVNTQTIISDMHRTVVKIQEVTGGKNLSVSVACILLATESTLTVAQARNRSAISAAGGPGISRLYIACLVNPRPHLRGPVADATN